MANKNYVRISEEGLEKAGMLAESLGISRSQMVGDCVLAIAEILETGKEPRLLKMLRAVSDDTSISQGEMSPSSYAAVKTILKEAVRDLMIEGEIPYRTKEPSPKRRKAE